VIELALIASVLGVIIGVTALFALVPWYILFGTGVGLIGLGMVLGVPTGFWFHVLLWRVMRERGMVVPRWWLRPMSVYERLAPGDRRRVNPWLYAGGAGFVLAIAGCALFAVGAFRS
jgi:hypothetical protein